MSLWLAELLADGVNLPESCVLVLAKSADEAYEVLEESNCPQEVGEIRQVTAEASSDKIYPVLRGVLVP